VAKRSHVVSDIERALLDELRKHELAIVSALQAPTSKTEFEFGRTCGRFQECQELRAFIEHYLNESDPTGRHEES
jgi:hypothetical protein